MSADGPGLFSDDTAFDVREEYRDALTAGLSDDAAMARVLAEFADDLDDVDTSSVVWLALAYTQSTLGRLDDQVRAKALEVMDSGADLRRWHEASVRDQRKRAEVLAKVRAQLEGPQPGRRKVRRPSRTVTTLATGQIILYGAPSGRLFLMRVAGLVEDDRTVAPVIRLLDYFESDLPSTEQLSVLPDYGPRRGWSLGDTTIIESKNERLQDYGLSIIGTIASPDTSFDPLARITTWSGVVDTLKYRDRDLSGADPAS
jgi:hypothetical protein